MRVEVLLNKAANAVAIDWIVKRIRAVLERVSKLAATEKLSERLPR